MKRKNGKKAEAAGKESDQKTQGILDGTSNTANHVVREELQQCRQHCEEEAIKEGEGWNKKEDSENDVGDFSLTSINFYSTVKLDLG